MKVFNNSTSLDHINSNSYDEAVGELKVSGSVNLMRIRELSYSDLDKLLEEIKRWSVYGNQDLSKLRATA